VATECKKTVGALDAGVRQLFKFCRCEELADVKQALENQRVQYDELLAETHAAQAEIDGLKALLEATRRERDDLKQYLTDALA
jgi:hypothetical protein